jgi:large subunit ribosomal protein L6e
MVKETRVKGQVKNRVLARGINALGKAAMMKKSHSWRFAGKNAKPSPKKAAVPAKITGQYPVDVKPTPLKRNFKPKAAKLRASITPGTVLVLLAGRFRGKRVVFLKQLASGLLLVSGPFSVNGVPLRRVNQSYVLATSTKVDISKVVVPATINDAYFAKVKAAEGKLSAEEFFAQAPAAAVVSAARKADQKTVDAALLKAVAAVPNLKHYLNAKFSLVKGDKPHLMQF